MDKIIRILNPEDEEFKIGQTKAGAMHVFHIPCNITMNFVKIMKKKGKIKNLYVCSACKAEYETDRYLAKIF